MHAVRHWAALTASQVPNNPGQTILQPPVRLPSPAYIHEVNLNNAGRDYIDQRQINHFNVDPERDSGLDVESRRRE